MKTFVLAITLIIPFSFLGQISDSIIYTNLKFNSEFEKKVFSGVKNDSINYIRLFLAIDKKQNDFSTDKIITLIENHQNLAVEGSSKIKSISKLANKIYKDTHKMFLRKYEVICNFSEIFNTGTYNCVSATALYAILFEKSGIDYIIKEAPNHVYLVVEPDGSNFLVESTLPKGGYISVDEKIKTRYVEYLSENKIISETEKDQKTVNELFDIYYYGDKVIGIVELAGIQYFNEALEAIDKLDFKTALFQLEKSHYLYKNERNVFLLQLCLASLIENQVHSPEDLGVYLARFSNYDEFNSYNNYVTAHFTKSTHEYIVDKADTASLNLLYNSIKNGIFDTIIKNEVDFVYNQYLGNFFLLKNEYAKGLDYYGKAYYQDNKNLVVKSAITECVGRYLADRRDFEKALDSLKSFVKKYPFLIENERIIHVYVAFYMKLAGDNYEMNTMEKGEFYLTEFENFIKGVKDFEPDGESIGYGYGQAFAYYVRKHNYAKAKEYLNFGLKIAPYSTELHRKMRTINEYLEHD